MKNDKIVHLREFTPWIARDYYQLSNSSPDISIYVPGVVEDEFSLSVRIVENFSRCNFETDFAFIIENNIGVPVGAIFASQNPVLNALDVYYFTGASHRNKGYMKAALKTFVAYIKHTTPYRNLVFAVRVDNEKSMRLLESLGSINKGIVDDWFIFEAYYQYELLIK